MARPATKIRAPRTAAIEAEIVRTLSQIKNLEAQISELKKLGMREKAIELYEEFGTMVFNGIEGVVTLTIANGSERLDQDAVRKLLTEDEIKSVTVIGAPTPRVTFTPKTEQ